MVVITREPMDPSVCDWRLDADIAWQGALAGLGEADGAAQLLARVEQSDPWPHVLEKAGRLRLAPLFYLGLQRFPDLRVRIPHHILEAFREKAHAAIARAAQLEHACMEVMWKAQAAGIRVLVIKGLALGNLVYPASMARPMDDVDLLVAIEDQAGLRAILHSLGYRNDLRGEEDFCLPGLDYAIDLHCGLVNTTRIPARAGLWRISFDELWARNQEFNMGGERVHTLGPADTLLHLAVHTVHHHGFRGILWAVDFLACMRTWRLRPSDVSDASPPIQRSLWYCLELLAANGVDPAPAMRLSVRPQRVSPLERRMIERLGRREVPEAIRYAFTLRCLPTWNEKVAFARQIFLPDPSVFSKGFIDAGGVVQSRGQHVRSAIRYGWAGIRAVLLGRHH